MQRKTEENAVRHKGKVCEKVYVYSAYIMTGRCSYL